MKTKKMINFLMQKDSIEENNKEKDGKIRKVRVSRIREEASSQNLKRKKVKLKKVKNCNRDEQNLNLYENRKYNLCKDSSKNLNLDKKDDLKIEKYFLMEIKKRKILNCAYISKYIQEKYDFIVDKDTRKIYLYNYKYGIYELIDLKKLQTKVYDLIPKKCLKYIKFSDIYSICNFLMIDSNIQYDFNKFGSIGGYINCKNKVYNINTKSCLQHDKKFFFFNMINANFDKSISKKDIKESKFYKFICELTQEDEELIKLLREIFGYLLSNLNVEKKFILFYGVPNSGKSVLINLLVYLIGEENVSHIPLQKLNEDKYIAELYGKLLNVSTELPDEGIKDTGTIKSLVSPDDKTLARPMYGNPISFYNKAKMVFSTNNLPSINNGSNNDNTAFYKRLIIIPFFKSIPEELQNKNLSKELKKEADIILRWAIEGLHEYIDNDFNFHYCKVSNDYLKKYINKESIVQRFVNNEIIFDKTSYIFGDELIESLNEYGEAEGVRINSKHKKLLRKILVDDNKVIYRKIHRDGKNKYGYEGIKFKY